MGWRLYEYSCTLVLVYEYTILDLPRLWGATQRLPLSTVRLFGLSRLAQSLALVVFRAAPGSSPLLITYKTVVFYEYCTFTAPENAFAPIMLVITGAQAMKEVVDYYVEENPWALDGYWVVRLLWTAAYARSHDCCALGIDRAFTFSKQYSYCTRIYCLFSLHRPLPSPFYSISPQSHTRTHSVRLHRRSYESTSHLGSVSTWSVHRYTGKHA